MSPSERLSGIANYLPCMRPPAPSDCPLQRKEGERAPTEQIFATRSRKPIQTSSTTCIQQYATALVLENSRDSLFKLRCLAAASIDDALEQALSYHSHVQTVPTRIRTSPRHQKRFYMSPIMIVVHTLAHVLRDPPPSPASGLTALEILMAKSPFFYRYTANDAFFSALWRLGKSPEYGVRVRGLIRDWAIALDIAFPGRRCTDPAAAFWKGKYATICRSQSFPPINLSRDITKSVCFAEPRRRGTNATRPRHDNPTQPHGGGARIHVSSSPNPDLELASRVDSPTMRAWIADALSADALPTDATAEESTQSGSTLMDEFDTLNTWEHSLDEATDARRSAFGVESLVAADDRTVELSSSTGGDLASHLLLHATPPDGGTARAGRETAPEMNARALDDRSADVNVQSASQHPDARRTSGLRATPGTDSSLRMLEVLRRYDSAIEAASAARVPSMSEDSEPVGALPRCSMSRNTSNASAQSSGSSSVAAVARGRARERLRQAQAAASSSSRAVPPDEYASVENALASPAPRDAPREEHNADDHGASDIPCNGPLYGASRPLEGALAEYFGGQFVGSSRGSGVANAACDHPESFELEHEDSNAACEAIDPASFREPSDTSLFVSQSEYELTSS